MQVYRQAFNTAFLLTIHPLTPNTPLRYLAIALTRHMTPRTFPKNTKKPVKLDKTEH